MKIPMTIISDARQDAGLSVESVALMVGCSPDILRAIESGDCNFGDVGSSIVYGICIALGLSADEVLAFYSDMAERERLNGME